MNGVCNRRSVFTHYLLDALKGGADRDEKGFVTVQDASRHVTDRVKLWASQRNVSQTPTLQYTVAGDIVLVKTAGIGSLKTSSVETAGPKTPAVSSGGVTIGNVSGGIHNSIIAGGDVRQTAINGGIPSTQNEQ